MYVSTISMSKAWNAPWDIPVIFRICAGYLQVSNNWHWHKTWKHECVQIFLWQILSFWDAWWIEITQPSIYNMVDIQKTKLWAQQNDKYIKLSKINHLTSFLVHSWSRCSLLEWLVQECTESWYRAFAVGAQDTTGIGGRHALLLLLPIYFLNLLFLQNSFDQFLHDNVCKCWFFLLKSSSFFASEKKGCGRLLTPQNQCLQRFPTIPSIPSHPNPYHL